MFFILLFSAISFGLGMPLMPLHIWMATICSLIFAYAITIFYDRKRKQDICQCWNSAILIMVFLMYSSGMFYDISYDGQVYHQEAVIQLANHWNPFQQYLLKEQSQSAMLLNHYAKGPWVYEAALYTVTGQIEQSKAFNFLVMTASFLLTFSTLKSSKWSTKQSSLFSLLLALNPVSIYQALSFYIDGSTSLLLCLLALSYRIFVAIRN